MQKYRYLPHTADVRFRAYGRSFEELLENSALALFGLIVDIKEVKKKKAEIKSFSFSFKGKESKESTLWEFLSRLLSLVRIKNVYAFDIKLRKENGKFFALVFFKKSKDYLWLFDVKAISPYSIEIKKKGRIFYVDVVADV
ncbi:MAG: archease [Candidatus Micrarchaeaceae archaeon]